MNTAVMERPPLVWITGTIVNKISAQAANRSGKIELDNGAILSAFSNNLQQVEIGHTYDFGCIETNKGGVTYRDVKTVRYAGPSTSTPSRPEPRQAASPQRSAPVNAHVDPPPSNNGNGNGGNFYRPTHPRDAERMFVTKILGDLIAAHIIRDDMAQMTTAVTNLRQVWQDTFGTDE